jgi:SAM-dependent methyltransferase
MLTGAEATAWKTKEQATWTRVVPGWRRHDKRLHESTAPITEQLIAKLRLQPGHHVLDIACGTGQPAIPIARLVGPTGGVTAFDFAPDMLAFAREKAAAEGLTNIDFRVSDGEAVDVPDNSYDAVATRFGLMFMPDPAGCLARAWRALKPGGRLSAVVWAGPDRNGWAAMPMGIIRRRLNLDPPPPGTPGLFALGDPARLRQVVESAGFKNVQVEPVEAVMVDFDSGRDYWQYTLDLAGPIASLYGSMPADEQAATAAEVTKAAEGTDGRVRLTGVALVASGEKA